MVDVISREEFDAFVAEVNARFSALGLGLTETEAGLVTLEGMVASLEITPMPQDVKDALIKVLEWMKVNV